jgi:hypothetical protein
MRVFIKLDLPVLLDILTGRDTSGLAAVHKQLRDFFLDFRVHDPEELVGRTLLRLFEVYRANNALNHSEISKAIQEVVRESWREIAVQNEVQLAACATLILPPKSERRLDHRRFLSSLLKVVLTQIDPRDRELVQERIVGETDFESLAATFLLSKGAVKPRYYRALDRLRLAFLRELLTQI